MALQMTFKRYETKYLLTAEQKEKILRAMQPYMALDQYGRSSIRNLYYDTEDFRLVRHSIDKPAYKEKVRVRSYGPAGERLIPEGRTLMEVKCSGGYPLWLVRILSEERIYKTSFSKYGTAYAKMILPHGRRMPATAAVRIPDRQRTRGEQWIGGKKYA